jgi:hypothetical protein
MKDSNPLPTIDYQYQSHRTNNTPKPFTLFTMPSSQISKDMMDLSKAIQFQTKYFAALPAQRAQLFHLGRFPNRSGSGASRME